MLGLIFALVGTTAAWATGDSRWDGAASLLIGVMLAVVAVLLAFEIKALLIGEAAGRRDRMLIRAALLGMDEVAAVGRLLTMHMGPATAGQVELICGIMAAQRFPNYARRRGDQRSIPARELFVEPMTNQADIGAGFSANLGPD